jgi:myo-inositol-1(or 4)-monophosphatase
VAAGRFDAFWEENLHAWDVAAGALIIREAGGKVTDYSGGKDYVFGKSIVAGNEKIHGELFRQLNSTLGGKVKSAS